MSFDEWVFSELINNGAIRDYAKNPPAGKGRSPKGSHSIQVLKIGELRSSPDQNAELWGLIGCTLLNMPEKPGVGPRLLKDFDAFAQKAYPEDPVKFLGVMQKAAVGAWNQYKANYKENVKVA